MNQVHVFEWAPSALLEIVLKALPVDEASVVLA